MCLPQLRSGRSVLLLLRAGGSGGAVLAGFGKKSLGPVRRSGEVRKGGEERGSCKEGMGGREGGGTGIRI